jgi:hypothetical protein
MKKSTIPNTMIPIPNILVHTIPIFYQLVPLQIPLPTGRKNARDLCYQDESGIKKQIYQYNTGQQDMAVKFHHTQISQLNLALCLHEIINVLWNIGLHLVSTMVSILLASTLPGWYGLRQNQLDITTSQVWT